MLPSSLVSGAVLGFSIAAPVGPIGLLCINRTLKDGMVRGLCTGMGAASADACYGLAAALGWGALLSSAPPFVSQCMRILGCMFLVYLGVLTIKSAAASKAASDKSGSAIFSFLSTFGLTIANPMTFLSFVAMIAATGAAAGESALLLVTGVFVGSAAWWLILCTAVLLIRNFVASRMVWINRLSGAIITLWGFSMLWQSLFPGT